jgi:hypothetical protein
MREVLGAGRGVQAGEVEVPAMAAEAEKETRQGAESDEESNGCDGAQDCERVYKYLLDCLPALTHPSLGLEPLGVVIRRCPYNRRR